MEPIEKRSPLRVVLASPRGFCAGVERAIETVERALALHGAPVYVRHEIVHNARVCDELRAKGAIFVDELEEGEEIQLVFAGFFGGFPDLFPQVVLHLFPLFARMVTAQQATKSTARPQRFGLVENSLYCRRRAVMDRVPAACRKP